MLVYEMTALPKIVDYLLRAVCNILLGNKNLI